MARINTPLRRVSCLMVVFVMVATTRMFRGICRDLRKLSPYVYNSGDDRSLHIISSTIVLPETKKKYVDAEGEGEERDAQGQEVCVYSRKTDAGSIFRTGELSRYGSGAYRYLWQRRPCAVHPGSPLSVHLLQMGNAEYILAVSNTTDDHLVGGRPDVIVIPGDERCECPPATCAGGAVRVWRQYHHAGYGPSGVPYVPLGRRYEFRAVPASEVVAARRRRYDFNLMISADTAASRAAVADVAGRLAHGFVNVAPKFTRDVEGSDRHVSPEEYRRVMLGSKFTLCPMGHNPESHRIYEAIEAGSIPILAIDEDYKNHLCKDAFSPMIESGFPGILLDDWTDLEGVLEALLADADKLDHMQAQVVQWKASFLGAAAAQFEAALASSRRQVRGAEGRRGADALRIPLVTGSARGGATRSVTQLLHARGISAVHEDVRGGHVSVSWLHAANARWYPSGNTEAAAGGYAFAPVVQLVRHPLRAIGATRHCLNATTSGNEHCADNEENWQFVDAFLPQYLPVGAYLQGGSKFSTKDPLDAVRRSMAYWLGWNRMIEARFPHASRMRLESMDPQRLVQELGMEATPGISEGGAVLAPVPVSLEQEWEGVLEVTWQDLLEAHPIVADMIRRMALRYGYEDIALSPPSPPP